MILCSSVISVVTSPSQVSLKINIHQTRLCIDQLMKRKQPGRVEAGLGVRVLGRGGLWIQEQG